MNAQPAADFGMLAGGELEAVEFDLGRAEIRLQTGTHRVRFQGVSASTLLSPWDGGRGVIEWLQRVHAEDDELCFELRVLFGAIPRVFKLVCRQVELVVRESAP